MYVYLITNLVTGLKYIGQTRYTVENRWARHVRKAKAGSIIDLHQAIREFGEGAFVKTILETCLDLGSLLEAERRWIRDLNTTDPTVGYNRTLGGQTGEITERTRQKISASLTGKQKTSAHRAKLSEASRKLVGPKNPFFGHSHTEATKQLIRDAMRGEKGPCYGRVRELHPMFGTQHTAASKEKMSRQRRGKTLSTHQKQRIREGLLARTLDRDRQMFEAFSEGRSFQEVADMFELTITSVYKVIGKAKNRELDSV